MHKMSQGENPYRKQTLDNYKLNPLVLGKTTLRHRQADVMFTACKPGTYVAELVGGYGKTKAAYAAYIRAKELGYVDRFLYISPGSIKCSEFETDLPKDMRDLGQDGEVSICDVRGNWAVRESQKGDHEFYMINIQRIQMSNELLDDVFSYGKWFVVIDESHHVTQDNEGGKNLQEMVNQPVIWLGLTATNMNRSGTPLFKDVGDDNIAKVTMQEALYEEAVRKVRRFETADYLFDMEINGTVHSLTTSELQYMVDEMDISEFEARKHIRKLSKYISPIIRKALEWYDKRNYDLMQDEHQVLIFAHSVSGAKAIAESIQDMRGNDFCDWIGTGDSGRKPADNAAILDRYKSNQLPCLVQCSMAGEGFDNPRSSILVYLSLKYRGVSITQEFYRGIRRNYNVPLNDDYAILLVPSDSHKAINRFQDLINLQALDEDPIVAKPANGDDDYPTLPDLDKLIYVPKMELNSWEDRLNEREDEVNKIAGKLAPKMQWSEEQAKEYVRSELNDVLEGRHEQRIKEQTRDQIKTKTTKAINRLIGMCIRINHKGQFQKTLVGDYAKSINGRYKYMTELSAVDLTRDEYENKYNWVKDLLDDIKEQENLPQWLRK